ncbi:MAG: S-adenosylmethionine decarboxylase [Planctomycetota bacterium]|jgi:S-adenosylmethionine/arginine decarboxylase-like enzyme
MTLPDEEQVAQARMPYGFELILDLHRCDTSTFNRKSLDAYFKKLCKAIDMQKCVRYFWDDVGVAPEEQQTEPHTKGTSAVQFILTSTIVVHTLDLLEAVYVNIFSCKSFDKAVAEQITKEWFGAKECRTHLIERI